MLQLNDDKHIYLLVEFVEADIELIASIDAAPVIGGDKKQLIRLINILEEDDDVQKVYHNCVEDLEEE